MNGYGDIMDPSTRVLLRQRDVSITIFRAGFVALLGCVLVFLYLMMVTNFASALLGGLLSLGAPLLCFVAGVVFFGYAVDQLKRRGIASRGILRRREHMDAVQEAALSSNEEDIWRSLRSQFGE